MNDTFKSILTPNGEIKFNLFCNTIHIIDLRTTKWTKSSFFIFIKSLNNVVLKSATVNTGSDIYLNTLGSGQVFLVIRDYNNGQFAVDYDLADFAANSATWSGTIGGVAHSGTVTTFNVPDFSNSSPAANDTQYVTSGAS